MAALAEGILAVTLVVDIPAVLVVDKSLLALDTCRFAWPTAVGQTYRSEFPIALYLFHSIAKTNCSG